MSISRSLSLNVGDEHQSGFTRDLVHSEAQVLTLPASGQREERWLQREIV